MNMTMIRALLLLLFVGLLTTTVVDSVSPVQAFKTWLPQRLNKLKQERLAKRRQKDNNNNVHKKPNFATLRKRITTKRKTKAADDTTTTKVWRSGTGNNNPMLWWDDLAPPFCFPSSVDLLDDYNNTTSGVVLPEVHATHFCFLVHGHRGFSNDLSYLQTVMEHLAEKEKRKRLSSNNNNTSSDPYYYHDIVVHSAICNERKTADGVEKGGERLVEEIISVIRQEMKKRQKNNDDANDMERDMKNITLSIVGNSLGGIYSRYAIAKLAQVCSVGAKDGCLIFDGCYRLHFNVFCTTATPHLGISKHTYVPLPRRAEIGVAALLGDTGKDLFRLNDLLRTMATSPEYLQPLAKFQKRIAYANAYATDFPVPASTAAFLSDGSDYPHHYLEEEEQDDIELSEIKEEDKNRNLFVAAFHTPPKRNEIDSLFDDYDNDEESSLSLDSLSPSSDVSPSSSSNQEYYEEEEEEDIDELLQMSNALDSLGWKKVFVDIRQEIPLGVKLPKKKINRTRRRKKSITNVGDAIGDSGVEEDDKEEQRRSKNDRNNIRRTTPIRQLKQKGIVESRDIISAVALPDDNRLSIPVGHNMIVAFSRSRISTLMNKGGRKVVDALAKELVEDIFSWQHPSGTETSYKE